MSHHSFFIIICLWIDTDYHSDFPLTIKVVFKKVSDFRVSVRNHLEEKGQNMEIRLKTYKNILNLISKL